jgi:spore coat protein U-like protein
VKYTHVLSASVAAVLSLALLSAPSAFAASPATTTIAVSATVANTCTLTAGTLPFGTYSGAKLSVTGTFTANCTTGADFIVALDKGVGTGATLANRLMTNTTNTAFTLGYSIYTTSGGATVWGDGTNGSSTVTELGTGAAITYNVYGVIPATEAALSGTYQDTVTATVTY